MSTSYLIGFRNTPLLSDLDLIMQTKGFSIEPKGKRKGNYSRVYVCEDERTSGGIEFFFEQNAPTEEMEYFVREYNESISSYGELKTWGGMQEGVSHTEKQRRIEVEKPKTEFDYYTKIATDRQRWYETALLLRDTCNAIVFSEQSGELIDPKRELTVR